MCCLETVYSGPFTLGKYYKNRSQHLYAIFLKSSVPLLCASNKFMNMMFNKTAP
jgi:hypothetical protein